MHVVQSLIKRHRKSGVISTKHIRPYQFDFMFLSHIFYFPKKIIKNGCLTLKCRGQVLQARHVVQCARECSFASLLPKIDSKYEVPMFI